MSERQSIRTPALADILIDGISEGIPLRQLCRENGISKSEAYRWLETDEDLKGRFARARKEGYDVIAERLRETARGTGESTQDVQRDKLIIDTDLKLLAKWDPSRYGDRITVNPDLGKTLPSIAISFVRPTNEE